MGDNQYLPPNFRDPDYIQDIFIKESIVLRSGKKVRDAEEGFASVWKTLYYYLDRPGAPPGGDHSNVSVATIWEGLKTTTTAHGIPHIAHARGAFKNAFWGLVVAFTIGCLIFNYSAITKAYLLYNVDVNIKLQHKRELQFPAITFCNTSPLRHSATNDMSPKKSRRKRNADPCEPDWTLQNDTCYMLAWDYLSWYDASQQCQSQGAHLVSILDEEEATWITKFTESHMAAFVWIGLNGWPWSWTDGNNLSYTNWFNDGVAKNPEFPCGLLADKSKWADKNCSNQYQFMCKKAVSTLVTHAVDATSEQLVTSPATYTAAPSTATTASVEKTSERSTTVAREKTSDLLTTMTTERSTTAAAREKTSDLLSTMTTERPTTAAAREKTSDLLSTMTTERSTTAAAREKTSDLLTTILPEKKITTATEKTSESLSTILAERTTKVMELTSWRSNAKTERVTTPETSQKTTSATIGSEAPTERSTMLGKMTTYSDTGTMTTTVQAERIGSTSEEIQTTRFEGTTDANVLKTTSFEETATKFYETDTGSSPTGSVTNASDRDWSTEAEGQRTSEPVSVEQTTRPWSKQTIRDDTTTYVDRTSTDYTVQAVSSSLESSVTGSRGTRSVTDPMPPPPSCCTCCVSSSVVASWSGTCNTCDSYNGSTSTTSTPSRQYDEVSAARTGAEIFTTATAESLTSAANTVTQEPPSHADTNSGKDSLAQSLALMSEDEQASAGFAAEELILDTMFAGYSVPMSEFELLRNPVHGNCFVFNSGWNRSIAVRKSSKTGRRYGLHVILNVRQRDYVAESGDTAAIRLVIHPQDRMPFPEDEGFNISPGFSTSIGIKQVQLRRQTPPYGHCIDPSENHQDINVFEEIKPVTYSLSACKKTCYQRHVISQCQCGDAYLPLSGRAFSQQPVPVCRKENRTQEACKDRVMKKFSDELLPCECRDSCSDTSYSFEVSFGMWPSKVHRDIALHKLQPKIGSSFDINSPTEYKRNLAKVEIYFEEFNFELITERPAYTIGSYLSNIGGVLGLWVGFSVMTLMEFLEFCLDVVVYTAVKCFKACRSTSDPNLTGR